MKRKIISLLLCLVMALSLIPTVAFAKGDDRVNESTKVDWKQFYGYTNKNYMSSAEDNTAGKCKVFLGNTEWNGFVTQADIARSGITIKPSAGYYVKQVVIACNDEGGYECQTAKQDGIVKFGNSTTESADYTIPASNLSLGKTINERPVWHSGKGTPLHLMIWLGISPNPVTVTYDAGEMKQLNSETLIAYSSETQPTGVVMVGNPTFSNNTITYNYDRTQSTAQPQHTILDMVAAHKTVTNTKDGKTYQFTGWKVLSSVDAAGDSGWNPVTGSSEPGSKLTLYTNYKLVAQWKEVETPTTGSLTINKNFSGLPDGTRPASVTFTVTGTNYNDTVTLSANNQWSTTLNLAPDTYTVTETSANVPGYTYTTTGTGNATVEAGKDTPVTVTNTYTPATTSVTVKKEWKHGDVPADMRPASVTVELLANGSKKEETDLTSTNQWAYTFENLPVKDSSTGADITYSVREVAVDGYQSSVGNITNDGTITITNTAQWEDNDQVNPASLTITKVDKENEPLSGATFTLTKRDDPTADTLWTKTETTGAKGTCTFTGLTEGTYILAETTAPDGYKQTSETWTIVVVEDEEPSGIVLNEDNTKFQKVYDCTVYHVVAEKEFVELTDGLTITNEKAPDLYTVTLPIQKIVEKKAGSNNPGKTTFAFAATMDDGQTETTTTYGTAIETNGVGTYDGKLTINVPAYLFPGGNGRIWLQVSEVKGTNSKWSYDDTVYIVLIQVEDYKVKLVDVMPEFALLATDDEAEEPTTLTFTNEYSYKYTPTPRPTTPKPVTSVKTGDMGVALYAVTSLLSLSGAAVIIKKRKDEE